MPKKQPPKKNGSVALRSLFMALLELLKLGKAHVMQTGNFGEMTLLPGRRESDLGEE